MPQSQPDRDRPHRTTDDISYFSDPDSNTLDRRKRADEGDYSNVIDVSKRRYATLDNRHISKGSTKDQPTAGPLAPPKPQRFRDYDTGQPNREFVAVESPTNRPVSLPPSSYGSLELSPKGASSRWMESVSPSSHLMVQAPPHDPTQPHYAGSFRSSTESGSVTPIIDEEARIRMDNMEQQLSGLSSLVHSALMTQAAASKSLSSGSYRDIESIHRDIFPVIDDHNSDINSSVYSGIGSDKDRYGQYDRDMIYPQSMMASSTASDIAATSITPELRHSIRQARHHVRQLQTEMCQLKRTAQVNAQTSRTIIRDVFDRIKFILNTNKQLHQFAINGNVPEACPPSNITREREWMDQEHAHFKRTMLELEKNTHQLEAEVEELRQRVINGNRRLRISEIERFADLLTDVGKKAADLKMQFTEVQQRSKGVMESEMERVVKEERFLKEEPGRIDDVLRRCKKITGMMVTMKKLAHVQDPIVSLAPSDARAITTAQLALEGIRCGSPITNSLGNLSRSRSGSALNSYDPRSFGFYSRKPQASRADSLDAAAYSRRNLSQEPPSTVQRKLSGNGASALDSILDELRSIAKPSIYPLPAFTNKSRTLTLDSSGRGYASGSVKFGGTTTIPVTPDVSPRPEPGSSDSGIDANGSSTQSSVDSSTGDYEHTDRLVPAYGTSVTGQRRADGQPTGVRKQTGSHIGQPDYASILRSNSGSPVVNGFGFSLASSRLPEIPVMTRSRSCLSKSPGNGFFSRVEEVGARRDRHRSNTPNSISSEPPNLLMQSGRPPPPPPRSFTRGGSSPNPLQGHSIYQKPTAPAKPPPFVGLKECDLHMKRFIADYQSYMKNEAKRSTSQTPTPSVQTNVIDDDSKYVRSASSSESINSQDGIPHNRPHPQTAGAMHFRR